MKLSKKGYELIKKFEGVRNNSYQDSIGIWTIGIGFIQVGGVKVIKGDKITDDEIEREFFKQILTYENCVINSLTTTITQNQFDSLISFVFNVKMRIQLLASASVVFNQNW